MKGYDMARNFTVKLFCFLLTLFGVLINGTIVSILQFNGTLSSWWTRIGVGVLTLIFIGIQSLFYMRKKHA